MNTLARVSKEVSMFSTDTEPKFSYVPAAAEGPAQPQASACVRSRSKRALDMFGSGVGLLLLLPLLLIVAVVIRLDSKGPAIFRQRRRGLNGEPFTIYKFRTMTVQENGAQVVQAVRNDPRLTRVGGFLRKSSLDELPQLMNVLKGDMSLVGPRPHAVAHDEHYSQLVPNYSGRWRAKPGLTGLAQVSGYRGETAEIESMVRRVEFDVAYVDTWSMGMDVKILGATLTSLMGDGSVY